MPPRPDDLPPTPEEIARTLAAMEQIDRSLSSIGGNGYSGGIEFMTFDFWLNQLGTLKTHKGNAPHKPLLLLTILEIAEQDRDLPTKLRLTPELAFRFQEFEHVVAHRRTQRLDIRLPFHHLGSSKIWIPRTNDGAQSPDCAVTTFVDFDPEFRSACLDAEFRIRARRILIRKYFEPASVIQRDFLCIGSAANTPLWPDIPCTGSLPQ